MPTDDRDLQNHALLFAGCESLWRDAKYSLMRRSYAKLQEMQKSLRDSRQHLRDLEAWLGALHHCYLDPVDDGADKNTLFHVMGYFKDSFSSEWRQHVHQLIVKNPQAAWSALESALLELDSAYLITSYVWRNDAWDKVWFRYQKEWYQLQIHPDVDENRLSIRVRTLGDWIESRRCLHLREQDLVDERFGVVLANRFVPYRPLWDTIRRVV